MPDDTSRPPDGALGDTDSRHDDAKPAGGRKASRQTDVLEHQPALQGEGNDPSLAHGPTFIRKVNDRGEVGED